MSIHFDIEELKTFLLLAGNGHFTETAQALGISQPAVSQRIARLENTFGLMLFTRSVERAELTSYGQKLHEPIQRCVESHDSMARRLSHREAAEAGQVRLVIDRSAIGEQLAATLGSKAPAHVRIDRMAGRGAAGWDTRLRNFECDLFLGGSFLQQPEAPHGLTRIELHREDGLSALWSPDHHPMEYEAFRLGDVLHQPLIVASDVLVPGFRGFVEDWCRRAYGTIPGQFLEYDTSREVFAACHAGIGIGLVPGDAGGPLHPAEPRLRARRLFGEVLPDAYAFCLYRRAGETREEVVQTVAWLVGNCEALKAPNWAPAGAGTEAA